MTICARIHPVLFCDNETPVMITSHPQWFTHS